MKRCFGVRGRMLKSGVLVVVGMNAVGCVSPLLRNLDAYRQAKKSGDYETAARHLTDDARIWFGKKEGEGHPLTAKGGPYKDWDREFRSTSTREDVRVVGETVTYISSEINDFYRLIERVPTKARVTYYFDEDNRITGMLYSGLSPKSERPPDRYDEFKQWAAAQYPGLLQSPEMEIPNNPKRWRELLVVWRADAGLKPIEDH